MKNINDYTGFMVNTLKLMPDTTGTSNKRPLDSYWRNPRNSLLDNIYIFTNMMFPPALMGRSLSDTLLVA